MNIDTYLLAEIAQNIAGLQLQLDYEREKIITALGGEPALYDVTGTGALTATTAKLGTGSAIAGATLQVDGDLTVGDGAGGTVFNMHPATGVCQSPKYKTNHYTIADDTAVSFTPSGAITGMLLLTSTSAGINAICPFRTTSSVFCSGLALGASVNVTTGALIGTTGTDGKVTISAHTDGKVYIENRSGSTTYISILIMGY